MTGDSGVEKDVAAVRNSRQNMVLVGLIAALIAPRTQRVLGRSPTIEEVSALMGAAMVLWHAVLSAAEQGLHLLMLYFPPPAPCAGVPVLAPPNPTAAAPPAAGVPTS